MTKLFKPMLIATLLAAGVAGSALAADDAPSQNPMPMMGKGRHMDPAQREAMAARHLQALHDQLKLQAKQEAAWKTYTESMKPGERAMPPKPQAGETAPQRMERMLDMMKQHQDGMQKRLDALKTFYAQLTPEQQKVMDQWHGPMEHKGRMGSMAKPQPK
ncbi:Spy/CpxP family protein refolding chaperone [Chromobacterium aquaticum]|uniref:Spy/CpxP family protein refolding chaperone n=1 Tax=Chromobacterium aquaticum TaxID=467180 RepID=A0ABV8ZRA6_9NEIS|nr:Spy/CpxP family protein refolding chaperone [Chromobacterium aquaticum]MCD5360483.1 Spy/CpxP family protein refolding chaperone [Chromobacterium aquaticum]